MHRRVAIAVLIPLALLIGGCGSDTSTPTTRPVSDPVAETSKETPTTTPAPTTEPTLPPTTTTTEPVLRALSVTVDADSARLQLTDASGSVFESTSGFEGEVAGSVELTVSADGYETENVTLSADSLQHSVWLDKSGQVLDKVAEFQSGKAPKQVAFRPGHDELWVTLLGGTGFHVYDPATGDLLADTDLPGGGSVEVIFNAAGTLAYVSQMETASVYEVDADSKQVLRQMKTGGVWTKVMVLSPDEQTLWASNWTSNDVSEIDLTTGEVVRILDTVTTPRGLYVTPDNEKLYVAGFEDGEIQVFDLETGSSETLIRTGGAMRHLVGSPDGSKVYASDMGRANVVVVNTATDEVMDFASVDRVPNTIDLSPDGQVLYVSNRGRNNPETYYRPGPEWGTVVVIDTATGNYLDAIVGGNQTTGLDVSPDGRFLAFSDFLDDRVVVYSIPPYEELIAGEGGRWEAHLVELVK